MTLTELKISIDQKNDWNYATLYRLYEQNNFTIICNLSKKILNTNGEEKALDFLLYYDLWKLRFSTFFSKEEIKTLLELNSKLINCTFIGIQFNKEWLINLDAIKDSILECSFENCTFECSYEEGKCISELQSHRTRFINCSFNSYSYKNNRNKINEMWNQNEKLRTRKRSSLNNQLFSTKTNAYINISENTNYEKMKEKLYQSELIQYLWNFTIKIFDPNFNREKFFEFFYFLKAKDFQTLLYLNEETFITLKEIWMRINTPIIIQKNNLIPDFELIQLFETHPETILSRTITNSQYNNFNIDSFLEFCNTMSAKNVILQNEQEQNKTNENFQKYRTFLEKKRWEMLQHYSRSKQFIIAPERVNLSTPIPIVSTSYYIFQIYPTISQKVVLKESINPDEFEEKWLQSPKHSFDLYFNEQGELFLDSLERKRIL